MRVVDFAVTMQDKIEENDHKEGWRGCSVKWLLNRARQEMGEVERAIVKGELPIRVQRECADVANFMMMVADNYAEDFEEKNPPSELCAVAQDAEAAQKETR